MAAYELTRDSAQWSGLWTSDKDLQGWVATVVHPGREAQVTEPIGAQPYERSAPRTAYRHGYRVHTLPTRVGPRVRPVPQIRDGRCSPALFTRSQRSEQALVLALMEMVLQGVSTRTGAAITEALGGTRFSRATVSHLCRALDTRVASWNERPWGAQRSPFVVIEALVSKVRREEAVRATSALLVAGINTEGRREVLGLRLGASASEATWTDMLTWRKQRGVPGVEGLVADAHAGLVQAAQRHCQGVIWQRCHGHLARHIWGRTPRHLRAQRAAELRRILQAADGAAARTAFAAVVTTLAGKADRALEVWAEGLDAARAVLVLPAKSQGRWRTTQRMERLHEEMRRRERGLRIFPTEASAVRLLGALWAAPHEAWSPGKRYVDMTEYLAWQATQAPRARRGLREGSWHNAQRRKANLQHILDLTPYWTKAASSTGSSFCFLESIA